MDIPNTGAIFTLGKSHLAENTQSYFYIKHDPIRRLIAGPHQSAVICESGRLFVWGENHYGQLGIGGQHATSTNYNNSKKSNNNTNNNNGDIIIKPTCVKSLKTLGLKIADMSFGNDWSIVLTLSNELFFTGRNIFSSDGTVSKNFTQATVNEELCEIIRRPFRLEEFDDCLSNNEEAENFVNVLAGNEHFVLLTSFGRLIGWGSNQSHQLGKPKEDVLIRPHEIVLDSRIKQFTCGPQSTLVLTESGKLYLTGRLNEFAFPDFTELQKNLSSAEQIIFMNISKASEIFVVTNTGSVYRSYESVRNKSLIFQKFYDYDSEENGPIWKLLKGTSFYAVLTKANKFFTTFSESGHHLKTFREISKYKNLRILDMAIGDKHILVHGIPRSCSLAATMGAAGDHRYMVQDMLLANTTGGILNRMTNGKSLVSDETKMKIENCVAKENAEINHKTKTPLELMDEDLTFNLSNNKSYNTDDIETADLNHNERLIESEESVKSFDTGNTVVSQKSPTHSMKAGKRNVENLTSSAKSMRPTTPFPEINQHCSPRSTMRKTPLRNLSYEAAISNDFINQSSPSIAESLENIPEHVANKCDMTVSVSTPPTEDDEELRLEISETTDPLNHTVTLNEIRFINNGIDVTANVKKLKSEGSEDSSDIAEEEAAEENNQTDQKLLITKQGDNFPSELEENLKKVEIEQANIQHEENLFKVQSINDATNNRRQSADSILQVVDATLESTAMTKLGEAVNSISDKTKTPINAMESLKNSDNSMENQPTDKTHRAINHKIVHNVDKASGEAKDAMNSALRKIAGDTKVAVGSVASKIVTEVQDVKNSLNSMLQYKKNKVDVQKPIEQDVDVEFDATSKESGRCKSNITTQSKNTGTQEEDDERTTASANSNHTASAGNPFESTDPFDPELDAMIQRGKQALREELQAASVAAASRSHRIIDNVEEDKSKFSKFLDDMREISKGLSCRNEKSTKIVEDQPPRYSVDDELNAHPVNNQTNGSKVCTIL